MNSCFKSFKKTSENLMWILLREGKRSCHITGDGRREKYHEDKITGGWNQGLARTEYLLEELLLLLLSRFSRVQLCATHRWQLNRLLCPWDSAGRNTRMGCHLLLQCMKVKSESEVTQSCPTLRDPMDCVAYQAPLSMGFPGKSTGVGCHCLLQRKLPI